ncbi:MAG: iron-sulfur cluster assembly scaffold protein [archaeon]
MNLYREIIMDHFKHPRNVGSIPDGITQNEVNPLCGDSTTLSLCIQDRRITDAKHITKGCAISIASMSLLTEHIKGKSVDEIQAMTADDMFTLIGTNPGSARLKCVLLPLSTLKTALARGKP